MEVLLTSFKKSKELAIPCYSVAIYQPKGFAYPEMRWFDIRPDFGDGYEKWIRPRDFQEYPEPLQAYRDALWHVYLLRESNIRKWFKFRKQAGAREVAFLCWCPYERPAQKQILQFGSFVCHTSVIGRFLKDRLGIKVTYDDDRKERMVMF